MHPTSEMQLKSSEVSRDDVNDPYDERAAASVLLAAERVILVRKIPSDSVKPPVHGLR